MDEEYEQIVIGGIRLEEINKEFIRELIYNKTKEKVLIELDAIDDAQVLYVYAYNYNWDDGFEIPRKILNKTSCELSTALLLFYLADGISYLENREEVLNSELDEWAMFIHGLYKQIINEDYKKGRIQFNPPLTKVEMYKLKKILSETEMIFIKEFGDINLDLTL